MKLPRLKAILRQTTAVVTWPEMERANAEAYLRKYGLPPGWERLWTP